MQTVSEPEYESLARSMLRAQFVAACPFPFLVVETALVQPLGPQRTEVRRDPNESTMRIRVGADAAVLRLDEPERTLVAVRKRQSAFPSMITVGRTANNDVVLPDVSVSKFHAFFQVDRGRLHLCDAGSRNGTAIGRQVLPKRGSPVAVNSGDRLRFGSVELALYDAAACWDALRQAPDW
jgi:hypothetical protein